MQSLHQGIPAGGVSQGFSALTLPLSLTSSGLWKGGGRVYLVKLEILGPKDKKLQARFLVGPRIPPR